MTRGQFHIFWGLVNVAKIAGGILFVNWWGGVEHRRAVARRRATSEAVGS